MKQTNFYNILEIEDYSSIYEVKKAFRKLALIYHPDLNNNSDNGEKFKLLVKAYETLKNPTSKGKYDEVLKNGFDISELFNFSSSEETEAEKRRKSYFNFRKEQDELQEVENIASYEKSLHVLPFNYRVSLIILFKLSGMFFILQDWYKKGSYIPLGSIIFFVSSLVLWNELYKYYWHKNIRNFDKNNKIKFDKLAYQRFIKVFATGILMLVLLINAKKVWHLHYFGILIIAENDYKHKLIFYNYDNKEYVSEYFSIPDSGKSKKEVFIKISSKEPEIWEFVD